MTEIGKEKKAFINRGGATDWDFSLSGLITDATWRDLNLSSIVPANARAILLRVIITSNTVGSSLNFRKKGESPYINEAPAYVQVAGVTLEVPVIVSIDETRIIQYQAANITWTYIYISVRGWWT